ncbi:hypothetical protein K440DRAFT_659124 [Wilcoxina mikolae CBS 423.85]|nr:hypothetical protein K440DRAFT_659124 [Wilcoxina mikolae CBS 423.85]
MQAINLLLILSLAFSISAAPTFRHPARSYVPATPAGNPQSIPNPSPMDPPSVPNLPATPEDSPAMPNTPALPADPPKTPAVPATPFDPPKTPATPPYGTPAQPGTAPTLENGTPV